MLCLLLKLSLKIFHGVTHTRSLSVSLSLEFSTPCFSSCHPQRIIFQCFGFPLFRSSVELIKAISQPWWKHTKTIVIKSIFFPSCQSRSRRLEFSPPNAPHLLVQPHRRLLLPSPPSPPIAVRCASRLGRPPATCPYLHQGKRVAVRARLL